MSSAPVTKSFIVDCILIIPLLIGYSAPGGVEHSPWGFVVFNEVHPTHLLRRPSCMKCRCLCLIIGLVLAACDTPRIPPVEPAEIRLQADVQTDTTRQGPAPDFVLPTLEGDSLRLSDFRGQVVVLNFWATWCAPCRTETPAWPRRRWR